MTSHVSYRERSKLSHVALTISASDRTVFAALIFLTVLIIILILNSPFLKERGVPPFRSSFVNLFPGNLKGFFLSNSGRILIDFWNCWT